MMVYGPREDSYFLRDYVGDRDLGGKKLLEIGTGTGIIAVEAAKNGAEVVATDIDPEALEKARENAESEGVLSSIEFVESDLFENVESQFDLIVFNPPYLPGERRGDSDALVGGDKGTELIQDFLKEARGYLSAGGEAVFLASSLSDIDEFEEFELEKADSVELWFETLYLFRMVN